MFKVGDFARVKYVRNTRGGTEWKVGAIVEIIAVKAGQTIFGDYFDYQVRCKDGILASPKTNQLEPIVKMPTSTWRNVEEVIGWNPTKETLDA